VTWNKGLYQGVGAVSIVEIVFTGPAPRPGPDRSPRACLPL